MGAVQSTPIATPANFALVRRSALTTTANNRAQEDDITEAGGHRSYETTITEQRRLNIENMLSKGVAISMVILFLLCILFGPDFNNANSNTRLFDLSPAALCIAYRIVFALWLTVFILYGLGGAWSKLRGYQRRVHRLLFIALIITAIAAKLIVPDQIQLSYAPAALTILAEVTYLLIDLTCQLLDALFLHLVPSLTGVLCKATVAIWNALKRWFAVRFDLHIGRE